MERKRPDKDLTRVVRRRRLICIILLALSVYFTYSIISLRVSISKEQQDQDALNRQVAEQRLLNEELERIIYNDGEREYIERIAREKLDYAAIDERIFVDIAGS